MIAQKTVTLIYNSTGLMKTLTEEEMKHGTMKKAQEL